jgi:hypothetical protein
MSRNRWLLAAAFTVLGVALMPGSATACLTCTSAQLCADGNQGASCMVYEDSDGRRWCQFTTDCGIQMTLDPLHISAAGTYLAAADVPVTDDGMEQRACNGFIVGHTADARGQPGERSIRI